MSRHIGVSIRLDRSTYMATQMLRSFDYPVHALGLRKGSIGDVDITLEPDKINIPDLHTVTLYLNPGRQAPLLDWILSLNPKRIIFNPGTENPPFMERCRAAGVEVLEACTLVMLSTKQY
ncbi:MAG: CoA-binding protein [Bacteroidota bacterium]